MAKRARVYAGRRSTAKVAGPKRADATERGYDRKWRRVRLAYLAAHPVCERCQPRGAIVEAVHVHHKDGQGPKGERGHDPDNLEALCPSCHNRHSATEAHRARRCQSG